MRSGMRLAGCHGGSKGRVRRWFVCCLAVGLAGLVVLPGVAFGSGSSPGDGSSQSGAPSLLGGPLAIPESPVEGQLAKAEREAKLDSPEAVALREESRTKFEGFSREQAVKADGEAFPGAVNTPAGGPPKLPAGEKVVGYPTDNAVQVDLPDGRHGVIETSTPVALETSRGHRTPIDLSLDQVGEVLEPKAPLVSIHIPKRLGDGVSLEDTGVSLTPVDAQGSPLGGAEAVGDGASAVYANTQTDADTVVKPTTAGFETDTILRSVDSPDRLYFKVGLPPGAKLTQAGSGVVRVLEEGATIATIPAPGAADAVGAPVPVSMSVSGDLLALTVDSHASEYQYPLVVDPTVTDSTPSVDFNNWKMEPAPPSPFHFTTNGSGWEDYDSGTAYVRGEWGGMAYETQGESHIYGLVAETQALNIGANIENKLFIRSAAAMEKEVVLGSTYEHAKSELCVESGCATGTVTSSNDKNVAEFKQTATNPGNEFWSSMSASVEILQEKSPTASVNTSSATIAGKPNIFHSGTWSGPRGTSEVTMADPGLGIYEWSTKSPNKSGWGNSKKYANAPNWCNGVQCKTSSTETGIEFLGGHYNAYQELPNGEDTIEVVDKDPVGLTYTASGKVKVDYSLPYAVTLSGLPANKELGNSQVKVKATAKDGTESFSGSGIESISLKIDGKEVGVASGTCSPGPCTATSSEWTVNGEEYAAGQHKATVTALSYAGDVATAEYTFDTGHLASPVALGPGSASPQTGEFFLNASDVSVNGGSGATLSVRRSYGSMHLAAGVEGPLGPQWSMSVGGAQSLTKAAEGSVVLTNAEGQESVFTSKGSGEFNSPPGGASLKLTEVLEGGKTKEFQLKDGTGQVTKFALPSGGTGNTWVPATLEGPAATSIVTYKFQTVEGVTEPTEVLGPVPTGVSCTAELVKGCRALSFVYSSQTTAKGEGASEWGEHEGRLKEVALTAWEPVSGKMQTTAVAEYVYDKAGKLRGEWNPSVSPSLETTYGYDTAGHLTALTPPGQQPWLFNYGTATGDPRARIVSVTRPKASTEKGNGIAPVNTVAPALSRAEAMVGVPLSVSTGTWSNAPLSYSYQWESCSGETCSPILGATSQTYTPESELVKLEVTVTATNMDGSASVLSARTKSTVSAGVSFVEGARFGSEGSGAGQVKEPSGIAVESASGSTGDVWVADTGNNRIDQFGPGGEVVGSYGSKGKGNGQFEKPTGIALSENDKYVYVSDVGNHRVEIFEASPWKYVSQLTVNAAGLTVGKFWDSAGYASYLCATLPSENSVTCYGIGSTGGLTSALSFSAGKEPTGVAIDEEGREKGVGNDIFVTSKSNHAVEVYEPYVGSAKYLRQFGSEGSGEGQFSSPEGIAVEPTSERYRALGGRVLTSDGVNNRVQMSSVSGENPYDWNFGTGRQSLALYESGEGKGNVWVANAAPGSSARIVEWRPGETTVKPPEPPNTEGSAVTTVEYHVPVSGSGAPGQVGKTEVEKWGQKDDPTEATAIFPPDEPMGWPAKDYRRATVYYLDGSARLVNVITPGGGISTTEYNARNEVERTLSPDNRVAALNKEGCESKETCTSAEASKLLDTEYTYGSEGSELLSTLGPQHNVKLASGTQVQARDHKQYFYNEGAPSGGGPYGLPTKTTEGAEYSGKEEDVRETAISYSGQENLGWKLRKPTSVTTDPKGLKLTRAVTYESSTGSPKETTTATGAAINPPPAYAMAFGTAGGGTGQFATPKGIAFNAKGEFWVADDGNHRIQEFNSAGEYEHVIGSFGETNGLMKNPKGVAVDGKGNIWVADTGNNRIQEFNSERVWQRTVGGTAASAEAGKFNEPKGIAVDSHNNVWVVDSNNNRLEEFNELGVYQKLLGKTGTGNLEFKEPHNVEIDSKGNLWVSDSGNNRVMEINEKLEWVRNVGTSGTGQLKNPQGITIDAKGNVWVTDTGDNRVVEFNEKGEYLTQFGSTGAGNGQFTEPRGIAIDSTGNLWVADTNDNRIEKWTPNTGGPHTTQTIYYSAGTESSVLTCQNHPEWANLPCRTGPVAQPGTAGLPELPVTTYSYNIWNEPATTTEAVGSVTRTKTVTYDAAGRLKTSTVSSSVGSSVPTVTDEHNKETGALEKQSTTTEGKTKTISSVYNKLGQLTSYTDTDGNTATYEYDIDGRIKQANDGKGTQAFTYNEITGNLMELVDSAAGRFGAGYDIEGNMVEEKYPNGMAANYTYNAAGTPTALEYKKTTHCTEEKEKCIWFKDAIVPSIHGQWLEQTSTLSHEAYAYDAAGRLTQVQDTQTGKSCVTRKYAYDEDTNRTGLATYEPNVKGECATEKGSEEKHTYDTADRLVDAGVKYNEFGDVTAVPAADAGGTELTSTYYSDNQLDTQTQNGQTVGYNLDPAGRTREIVSTGTKASDIVNHYAGPGNAPAWTSNVSGEWTRNIPGIAGSLAAIQNNGETPVLQLTNLHGDIIATAYLSETATALASTANTTEYGVPAVSAPPKYSWLGSVELATELPSGAIDMGARSYIPQLGRFLQPDPIPGGSANAYAYTFGDPVNSSDPSGALTYGFSGWLDEANNQEAKEVVEREVARETLEREEAERKASEAAEAEARLNALWSQQYPESALYAEGGEEEWGEEEWWEEEGWYEYASYQQSAKPEGEGFHIEDANLIQSVDPEGQDSQDVNLVDSVMPQCQEESGCKRDVSANLRASPFVHVRRPRLTITIPRGCPIYRPVHAEAKPRGSFNTPAADAQQEVYSNIYEHGAEMEAEEGG
jgi:RHS repeat-associated protein